MLSFIEQYSLLIWLLSVVYLRYFLIYCSEISEYNNLSVYSIIKTNIFMLIGLIITSSFSSNHFIFTVISTFPKGHRCSCPSPVITLTHININAGNYVSLNIVPTIPIQKRSQYDITSGRYASSDKLTSNQHRLQRRDSDNVPMQTSS
jgi:hypothetical protein